MNQQKEFEKYIENFKTFSLQEKRNILLRQLKLLAGFADSVCKDIGADSQLLISKELLNLNEDGCNEEEFIEAIVVLVNSIQNSICDFHIKLSDLLLSNN